MKRKTRTREEWKTLRVGRAHDKRIKLTKVMKAEIVKEYAIGDTSHNKLATRWGVSKRLISFVLNPEKQRENYRQRVAKGGSKQYYDKDKWREYMRTHRKHLREIHCT